MIVTVEAFLRKIWRVFSHEEWMSRLLNLSKIKDASAASGLVMIQIDGLGFTQLKRAMQNGNMPFLSRLLKKESYVNYRHYTGLPSNTPAVQGEFFYGVKACVPAFSFKDSQTGQVFNMFNPESAAAVEDRLKDKGKPLLEGGSSYGNIFTGGAKEAHFCASSIGWGGLLKAANPLGVPLTVLLNIHIFIRALFLMIVEIFLALFDSIRNLLSGKNFMADIGFIPLRVAICVLLREVIATAARIDIARGLPVIHINLAGYDEQAHHRGPTSAFAHWSLRGIDSAIAGVWKAAQRSQQRHYDVFIYSDHGQEDTISYQKEHGRSVREAVNKIFEETISSSKWQTEFNEYTPHWRAHLLRNKPERRSKVRASPGPSVKTAEDAHLRAVVTAMGPVGHIYPPVMLSIEEKEKLAQELVASAKIPIVMLSNGPGEAFAWNSQGKFVLPKEADKIIETQHPFFKEVVEDLVNLCHHPDAGELIIFGWRKGFKSLTFHGEQGSHAGPGPEETSGFALLPADALSRAFGETVHTQDLREAAFRALGRGDEKPFLERRHVERHPSILRIMTYNVHGCLGGDGKISPIRIARIIARHNPDVVALQELKINEKEDQAEIIARKLAMAFRFDPSLFIKKGRRGNAILSKFPMRPIRNGSLPKLARTGLLEPRGALWVEIDIHGQKVQVFNTHLSLSPREGLLQIKALCGPDWMENPACRGPVILCGDLNASSNSKICKHLGQVLKNTHFDLNNHRPLKTLPSFYPLRLIDHIFVGPGIKTAKIEVPRTHLEKISSDHLPLIVEIQVG